MNSDSVVRKIWGKEDTVLFIFAGASAEFALNKAVDWLYFTGRLPADPLGRLFSTLKYAQGIVFTGKETALQTIDKITSIHVAVENNRGDKIPVWAYRDVLFMLIYYSQAAFELLERKMTETEKEELFDVFYRVGLRMGIEELPRNYSAWLEMRKEHMENDLSKSEFTVDLYQQYRKHLGWLRYWFLIELQKLIVPKHARRLLKLKRFSWFSAVLFIYKLSRKVKLDRFLKTLVLPSAYRKQIMEMDLKEF